MTSGKRRVQIKWTKTAGECMRALPKKVRAGLFAKADLLMECDDPANAHKPLVGPLQGYNRITYSRYRAAYTVTEDKLASGDVLVTVTVTFVAAGKREERSKGDVYKLAEKIVGMGIIDPGGRDDAGG